MSGPESSYTLEIAQKVCMEVADGRSLRSIAKDEGMPAKRTIFKWLAAHEEFRALYAIAKEESADVHAEDILDIADDGSNDWMAKNDPENPGYVANGEHIARSRLRVDTRKWIACKLKPKKYGDKVAVGGAEDLPPVKFEKIERVIVDPSDRSR